MFTFKKNILWNTPARSETGFEKSWANFSLEQTFKIFKNIQKHIPASGVNQGHSTTCCMQLLELNF